MKQVTKCLIKNENDQILFLKRSDDDDHGGSWETPGGGVDEGETLEEGCIREVKEEAGCDITDVKFFETIQIPDSETAEVFEVHLFSATLKEGSAVNLDDNPDHQDSIWLKANEVGSLDKIQVDSWTKEQLKKQL